MANTTEKTLTGSWQAVATAGEVLITPSDSTISAFFAVTSSTIAPTFTGGHTVHNDGAAMALTGTERLWVQGEGKLYVTADAPVI